MNDKMNKASICSIVSLDIIDFSVKSETEKLEVKSQFDNIVNHAMADIPEDDRVIVDAVNGVAIACSGQLENALEDALFISLTIRDEILKNNIHSATPLYVQLGINMGSVQRVNDADGKPSLVGDGLDDAQRVMCFANPNQILVSRAYYESASKLTHEISQMFEKYDMHTLEHDVYAVRLLKDVIIEDAPSIPADIYEQQPSVVGKINWRYIASVSLGLLVFFAITKVGLEPSEPIIILDEPVAALTTAEPMMELASESAPTIKAPDVSEQVSTDQPSQVEATSVSNIKSTEKQAEIIEPMAASKQSADASKKTKSQNKLAQKVEADAKSTSTNSAKPETNAVAKATDSAVANKTPVNSTANEVQASAPTKYIESKVEKSIAKEKSGWESFKDGLARGAERKCTQGEVAMNQCDK